MELGSNPAIIVMAVRVGDSGGQETQGRCDQWPPSCKSQEVLGVVHRRVIPYFLLQKSRNGFACFSEHTSL